MALCRRLKMRIILERERGGKKGVIGVIGGYDTPEIFFVDGELRVLLRLLTGQTQEEVVEEGGELVADQDPVLVDQIVGGDVGVGPTESLLQRVPLEGGHHVVLCKNVHRRGALD